MEPGLIVDEYRGQVGWAQRRRGREEEEEEGRGGGFYRVPQKAPAPAPVRWSAEGGHMRAQCPRRVAADARHFGLAAQLSIQKYVTEKRKQRSQVLEFGSEESSFVEGTVALL
jgi:hypothetical protein